ncbi:MAG: hypothetical protein PHI48_04415 [Bacteroidales bacterium]|nr:hypothetical protein [Bacteroidales bacterium]
MKIKKNMRLRVGARNDEGMTVIASLTRKPSPLAVIAGLTRNLLTSRLLTPPEKRLNEKQRTYSTNRKNIRYKWK